MSITMGEPLRTAIPPDDYVGVQRSEVFFTPGVRGLAFFFAGEADNPDITVDIDLRAVDMVSGRSVLLKDFAVISAQLLIEWLVIYPLDLQDPKWEPRVAPPYWYVEVTPSNQTASAHYSVGAQLLM